jgi:hypothetical protein
MGMQLTRNLVIRSILPLAVVGLALAGCTTKEPGDPTAGGTATTTKSSGGSPVTTTKPSSGGSSLADFDPCAEMTAVASRISLTEIEEDGRQECKARWGQSTTAVRVKAFPELSIGEVVGGANSKFTDLTIGSHKARMVTAPSSSTSCAVTVEITAKSRVDVVASATSSQDEACDAATKLATAIEPKLPK